MTASDKLPQASRKVLPSSLQGTLGRTDEELDSRYYETSESLVLALLRDVDAPYYLAKLVALNAQKKLVSILSAADSILVTLDQEPADLPAPSADRSFELAQEALQRIKSKSAVGAAPSSDDIDDYVGNTRTFAATQLAGRESVPSRESYRAALEEQVGLIDNDLADLHALLGVLSPSEFFIDDLTVGLSKSKQLAAMYDRISSLSNQHKTSLTSSDAELRSNDTSTMLAETATSSAMVASLRNLVYLQNRHRVSGKGYPVGTYGGVTYGSPSAASVVSDFPVRLDSNGLGDVYVPLDSTDSDIQLTLNEDFDNDPVAALGPLTLPASAAPAAIVLTSPVGGWTQISGFVVGTLMFVATVLRKADGRLITYAARVEVPHAGGPHTGSSVCTSLQGLTTTYTYDEGGALGPLLNDLFDFTSPAADQLSIGIQSNALWRSQGHDVKLLVTNPDWDATVPKGIGPMHYMSSTGYITSPLLNELNDASATFVTDGVQPGMYVRIIGGSSAGYHRILEVQSETLLTTEDQMVATPLPPPYETYEIVAAVPVDELSSVGTSPTLSSLAAFINASSYGGYVIATAVPAARSLRISTLLHGVNYDSRQKAKLTVVQQPQYSDVDTLFGFPVTPVWGSCKAVAMPGVNLAAAGIANGMQAVTAWSPPVIDILVSASPEVFILKSAVSASTVPSEVTLYAKGARSYQQSVEVNSVQYSTQQAALLDSTENLREYLGRSANDKAVKRKARELILGSIGSVTDSGPDGPAEQLLALLRLFLAPESASLSSAINLLRERGFEASVDLLLSGRVPEALDSANASYQAALRKSMAEMGLNGLGVR